MGCDIHSVAQVRRNGTWETVLQDVAGDPRNYVTFGMLAGVRNYNVDPISEPRGYPEGFTVSDDDLTPIQEGTPSEDDFDPPGHPYREEIRRRTEVWMGDHSHSWLTLAEISDYMKAMPNREDDLVYPDYLPQICQSLGRLAEQYNVGPEDVRMVFGFDS